MALPIDPAFGFVVMGEFVPWSVAEAEKVSALYPSAAWRKMTKALPGRSKAAIANYARARLGLRRRKYVGWTDAEVAALREKYPRATEEELRAALPGRSRSGIAYKAKVLKVRRLHPATRANTRPICPLLIQLRAERERRKLSRRELAERAGYHVTNVLHWETGKVRPFLGPVLDLADALGFEVVLQRKRAVLEESIPWPDRQQLMARR